MKLWVHNITMNLLEDKEWTVALLLEDNDKIIHGICLKPNEEMIEFNKRYSSGFKVKKLVKKNGN